MQQTKLGRYIVEQFPEGFIQLNRELSTDYHPRLQELLAVHPIHEVEVRLAAIASYCEVILDGTYTLDDRDRLCFILVEKLKKLRQDPKSQIIIPH